MLCGRLDIDHVLFGQVVWHMLTHDSRWKHSIIFLQLLTNYEGVVCLLALWKPRLSLKRTIVIFPALWGPILSVMVKSLQNCNLRYLLPHYLQQLKSSSPFHIAAVRCWLVVVGNKVCSFANFIILSRPKDGHCTEEGGSINNKLIYLWNSAFFSLCLYFLRHNLWLMRPYYM